MKRFMKLHKQTDAANAEARSSISKECGNGDNLSRFTFYLGRRRSDASPMASLVSVKRIIGSFP